MGGYSKKCDIFGPISQFFSISTYIDIRPPWFLENIHFFKVESFSPKYSRNLELSYLFWIPVHHFGCRDFGLVGKIF